MLHEHDDQGVGCIPELTIGLPAAVGHTASKLQRQVLLVLCCFALQGPCGACLDSRAGIVGLRFAFAPHTVAPHLFPGDPGSHGGLHTSLHA